MGREPWQPSKDTRCEAISDNPSFPAKVPRGCSIEPEMTSSKAMVVIGGIPDRPDEPNPADKGYAPFPHHLLNRLWKFKDGKSYAPMAVYGALLEHDKKHESEVFPSITRLREMTRLSASTIQRSLRHLEKMGLIHTEHRNRKSSVYRFDKTRTPQRYQSGMTGDTGQG